MSSQLEKAIASKGLAVSSSDSDSDDSEDSDEDVNVVIRCIGFLLTTWLMDVMFLSIASSIYVVHCVVDVRTNGHNHGFWMVTVILLC